MKIPRKLSLQFILVILWLVTSLALASWWLIFGLSQIDRIGSLQNACPQLSSAHDVLKQHRMLLSEGSSLFVLLLMGGLGLLYAIRIEIKRAERLRSFFLAVNHDAKTALASLRLQTEALQSELQGSALKISERIVKDSVRLELQLNNSLIFSQDDQGELFIEEVKLNKMIESLKYQWPETHFHFNQDAIVKSDKRALDSIIKNLVQNALVHGKAKNVYIDISSDLGELKLKFTDDGVGFKGNLKDLGKLFKRHSNTSGSGIGLYLVRELCQRMQGRVQFEKDLQDRLIIYVYLPGRLTLSRENTKDSP